MTKNAVGEKGSTNSGKGLPSPPFRAMLERKHFFFCRRCSLSNTIYRCISNTPNTSTRYKIEKGPGWAIYLIFKQIKWLYFNINKHAFKLLIWRFRQICVLIFLDWLRVQNIFISSKHDRISPQRLSNVHLNNSFHCLQENDLISGILATLGWTPYRGKNPNDRRGEYSSQKVDWCTLHSCTPSLIPATNGSFN